MKTQTCGVNPSSNRCKKGMEQEKNKCEINQKTNWCRKIKTKSTKVVVKPKKETKKTQVSTQKNKTISKVKTPPKKVYTASTPDGFVKTITPKKPSTKGLSPRSGVPILKTATPKK